MPRIDRDLRIALGVIGLLTLVAGGSLYWLIREPAEPSGDAPAIEDPPEITRALARQEAARRQAAREQAARENPRTPAPAPGASKTAPRRTIALRPLPEGARVQTLAEARKLPAASFDLGYTALLLSRQANPKVDIDAGLARLDAMAKAILRGLPPRTSAQQTARVIADELFVRLGFRYHDGAPDGVDPRNAYLDRVLGERRGYCLTLSVLYLALAERLGLPLTIVELPDHVFVRWEAKPEPLNIETTAKGTHLPDATYARRHPFPKAASRYYLRSRPPRTAIAYLLLSHGMIHWQADRIAEARRAFLEGLAWEPGNLYLTYNLANVELKQSRWEEAARLYERFLELRPDKAIGWLGLARARVALDQLGDADDALAKGVASDPNNAEIRLVQAELAYRRKRYEQVHALLSGKQGLAPEAMSLRARAHAQTGQHAEAAALWQTLVSEQPEHWPFRRKLAQSLMRLGRTKEATGQLEAVLVARPKDVYALATLGMFAYQARQFGKAVTLFRRALAEEAGREVIYNNLASSQLENKQAEAAARTATRGLRRFPRSKGLARLAGLTYLRHLRDPVKARRYLAHYRRLGGDDPEILRWLATKK